MTDNAVPPISIEDRGSFAAAQQAAEQARQRLLDGSPAMKRAAVYLDQWVQRNIQSKGGKVGGWEPFRYGGRITTKDKATAYNAPYWVNLSAQLLQDTGRLRLSMLPFSDKAQAGIGSDLPYSAGHQNGIGRLPQRRILPNKDEVYEDLKQIVGDWVAVTIKETRTVTSA